MEEENVPIFSTIYDTTDKFNTSKWVLTISYLCSGVYLTSFASWLIWILNYYMILQFWQEKFANGLGLSIGLILLTSGILGMITLLRNPRNSLNRHVSFKLLILCLVLPIFPGQFGVDQITKQVIINGTDHIKEDLTFHFNNYNSDNDAKKYTDLIQRDFKCCGGTNPQDWNLIFHNNTLPSSCCVNNKNACNLDADHYEDGCLDIISSWVKMWLYRFTLSVTFPTLFQGMFLAMLSLNLYPVIQKSPIL